MNGSEGTQATGLDLETALRDLAAALAPPPSEEGHGDLAARVRSRIEAEWPQRAGAPWWREIRGSGSGSAPRIRRSLLLATVALLVVAAAVTAAVGYGLPGIRILFGSSPLPSSSVPGSEPPSGLPGALVGLGTPLPLEQAAKLIDFDVVLPPDPAFGAPDAVYLAGPRLALVWGPGPGRPGTAIPGVGLLLVEVHATVDLQLIDKLVSQGTTVERISVAGAPGYWIAGARHQVVYITPDGSRIEDSARVAGNTLVWTADGISYKLEGDLTRDDAIALAATLR